MSHVARLVADSALGGIQGLGELVVSYLDWLDWPMARDEADERRLQLVLKRKGFYTGISVCTNEASNLADDWRSM